MLRCILILALGVTFAGCSSRQSASADDVAAERMAKIATLASTRAENESHRQLLQRGKVFVNLEDLDVPCIGVSVVINEDGNRAFLSFTREWFDEHDDDAIAAAMLEDLAKALSEKDAE